MRSILLVLVSTIALAQTPTVKLMEENDRLQLVVAYQKAIIAQAKFSQAVNDYNALSEAVAKKMGLPPHSQFNINTDTSEVTPIVAKVEPVKGEAKK